MTFQAPALQAAPAEDFMERARSMMVDGQLRPSKVRDPRILNAMRAIERERFVPPAVAPFAYLDEDLDLGSGRALMEPMVLARLIQALRPAAGQRALVVGAGAGYGAAVLAACGPRVLALEQDGAMASLGRAALARHPAHLACDVSFVAGPIAAGWEAGAPYDLILIEGAVDAIPPAIAAQLRPDGRPGEPTGRLATVIAGRGNSARAVLAEPVPGGLRARPIFDCATPVLPGFAAPAAFSF